MSAVVVGDDFREFVLAMADDKHLMGQQHAEWIGIAPFLEEDLAFCSIAQDELGHAALLYALVAGDEDREIDALAFGRAGSDYRSSWLCEYVSADWTETVVRHWMFDHAEASRWELLADSPHIELASIARRVESEERYHRRHADSLISVLMQDPDAARSLHAAAQALAPLALTMFEPVAGEPVLIDEGVLSGSFAATQPRWQAQADARFGEIDWDGPVPGSQNQRQSRSVHWQPVMDRMREVLDLDPAAVW